MDFHRQLRIGTGAAYVGCGVRVENAARVPRCGYCVAARRLGRGGTCLYLHPGHDQAASAKSVQAAPTPAAQSAQRFV